MLSAKFSGMASWKSVTHLCSTENQEEEESVQNCEV
jgi:hypothetical protein